MKKVTIDPFIFSGFVPIPIGVSKYEARISLPPRRQEVLHERIRRGAVFMRACQKSSAWISEALGEGFSVRHLRHRSLSCIEWSYFATTFRHLVRHPNMFSSNERLPLTVAFGLDLEENCRNHDIHFAYMDSLWQQMALRAHEFITRPVG